MEVDIKFDFVTGNQDIQNHHADRTDEFLGCCLICRSIFYFLAFIMFAIFLPFQ